MVQSFILYLQPLYWTYSLDYIHWIIIANILKLLLISLSLLFDFKMYSYTLKLSSYIIIIKIETKENSKKFSKSSRSPTYWF